MQYSDSNAGGRLPLGIVAGFLAAILGAFVWAAIAATTNYEIGFMAIGIGFIVAFAVRWAGRGHGLAYGIAAAALSLFGCVLGDFLAACVMLANHQHAPILPAIRFLLPHFVDVIKIQFDIMSAVFYAFGVYFGFKYATVPLNGQPRRVAAPGPSTEPSEPTEAAPT